MCIRDSSKGGKITEIQNLTNNTTIINEIDENDNLILKNNPLQYHEFKYDENNMMISENVFWNANKSLTEFTFRKIVYK